MDNIFTINSFNQWLEYKYQIVIINSEIILCSINDNNIDVSKLYYHSILYEVYKIINDYNKIMDKNYVHLLNYKTDNNNYNYIEELNISFPKVYLGYPSLIEILYQCMNNNIKLNMLILLHDGRYIKINL